MLFDGLAYACKMVAGKSSDKLKSIGYKPKQFNLNKNETFSLRAQHFLADLHQILNKLNWTQEYD
ncbi:MAG: hypothetical protein ACQZ3M_08970 [cyanobacterium endosymbiont of Rhopalodia fuxianensis]